MNRRYTIHGRYGIIGTMFTFEEALNIVAENLPKKNPYAVLENTHAKTAYKTGHLTIIVVQPRNYSPERMKQAQELTNKNNSQVTGGNNDSSAASSPNVH